MGRRRKCRFVADVPEVTVFKPQGVPMGQLYGVVLGLDGFEAMRLVDGEGLSQEEAAARMGVSRPTLCRILAEARGQVARALARGWAIRIEVDGANAPADVGGGESMASRCLRGRSCGGGRKQQGGQSCVQDKMGKADEAERPDRGGAAGGKAAEGDAVNAGPAPGRES